MTNSSTHVEGIQQDLLVNLLLSLWRALNLDIFSVVRTIGFGTISPQSRTLGTCTGHGAVTGLIEVQLKVITVEK